MPDHRALHTHEMVPAFWIASGIALVAGLIWAVVDNVYVYKRRHTEAPATDDHLGENPEDTNERPA